MSKKSAALARVRQLACLGLPAGLFVSSLLPLLRGLTGSDSAAFFWMGEAGGIVNFYADRFPPLDAIRAPSGEAPIFLSESAGWSESPLRPFATPVLASTVDAELANNSFYNEILKRNGAHYILHGMVRHEGVVVGRLSLFRSADGRPFGLKEMSALSGAIRYLAQGVSCPESSARHADHCESGDVLEQDIVIADRAGRLVHATERGRRLLLLSTGCALGPRTFTLAGSVSQQLLRAVCVAGAGHGAAAMQMSRETVWGRFVLRGYWLDDEMQSDGALVGVHIMRNQPACLRFVNAMSALPLSPQQREIALMIARGSTNRDIAMRLSVSVNTVAYHIKQLFYKLHVHDRAELLATINGAAEASGQASPAWADRQEPSPVAASGAG